MADPSEGRKRAPREETWKKLWATPVAMTDEETEAAFDELVEALVPGHMQGRFSKRFGVPRERFGNRFFVEGASFWDWKTKINQFGTSDEQAVVEVIVASGDELKGTRLRGQSRRTLKDIVIDDLEAVCAIVRLERSTVFMFSEPGMKGAIVITDSAQDSE